MKQHFTSANTSINSSKLPAVYGKVDFGNTGLNILDYGCGKFDNGKQFIEAQGLNWFGYDPFNRPAEENAESLMAMAIGTIDVIVSSNVLNVIDSDEAVNEIAESFTSHAEAFGSTYFVTVYEGNGSGAGKQSQDDCYQRNQKTREYLKFFPGATIRKGVITNHPECIK